MSESTPYALTSADKRDPRERQKRAKLARDYASAAYNSSQYYARLCKRVRDQYQAERRDQEGN